MFELIPFDRSLRRMANFDPFRELEDMERSLWGGNHTVSAFRTDVIDTGDAYQLQSELPGFKKDDIRIDVENDVLTISAERKFENDETGKNSYVKRERYYGRRFTSKQELIHMIESYIHYYNTRRVQRNLGVLTPMEKHKRYLAA